MENRYNSHMKLPNGKGAVVEDRKLLEYVLNPLHPVGRHHAQLFKKYLGIDRSNAVILKRALQISAVEEEVFSEIATEYGKKYLIRFEMSGPDWKGEVVSVWIVEEGRDRPRLVTCYVE